MFIEPMTIAGVIVLLFEAIVEASDEMEEDTP